MRLKTCSKSKRHQTLVNPKVNLKRHKVLNQIRKALQQGQHRNQKACFQKFMHNKTKRDKMNKKRIDYH